MSSLQLTTAEIANLVNKLEADYLSTKEVYVELTPSLRRAMGIMALNTSDRELAKYLAWSVFPAVKTVYLELLMLALKDTIKQKQNATAYA